MTLVVMFGAQDMATGTVLVLGGAGAFMRQVLIAGAVMRMIGAVMPLVTLLVTMVADNSMRGWIQGGWTLRVGLHGPVTIAIKATIIASGTSPTKTGNSGG